MRISCKCALLLFFITLVQACEEGSSDVDANPAPGSGNSFFQINESARTSFYSTRVDVQGYLFDENNLAVAGAVIRLGDLETLTDSQGAFSYNNIARINQLLVVKADGYHEERIALALNLPQTTSLLQMAPIILKSQESLVRFAFGGDVAFARRFLDTSETTPPDQVPLDDPEALIQASNPQVGTEQALQWIRPHFNAADFAVVNFETPVTDNPITPHPEKAFVFFTLPESIPGLQWMGTDYVSLGNNHVYDYLESGLQDTINNLQNYELPFSGAGTTSAEAYAPYRTTIKQTPYSFISATSVSGSQHSIEYVASDVQGGAADLRDNAAFENAITEELQQGYSPIVQLHTGKEYTFEPSSFALEKINQASDLNASLVVAHHPHVAQGVGIRNGVYQIHGLGNLVFDQARLETMLSQIARVDMNSTQVEQIRMLPIYLKDFRPRLISGDLANIFLRRVGEFSNAYGLKLYSYLGQGWVVPQAQAQQVETETLNINVDIDSSGKAILDLRQLIPSDYSLSRINFAQQITARLGRDILSFGDMEDWDLDDNLGEAARWDISSSSRYLCYSEQYRGINSLCSERSSSDSQSTVLAFRNRIRVMGDALDQPNKDLSLLMYAKGINAGSLSVLARYYASIGEQEFGEEVIVNRDAGDYNWTSFSSSLNMPAEVDVEAGEVAGEQNARALRLFIHHSPPADGQGQIAIDDMAVVNWEEQVASNTTIITPHARDFILIEGATGSYTVELSFERFKP